MRDGCKLYQLIGLWHVFCDSSSALQPRDSAYTFSHLIFLLY